MYASRKSDSSMRFALRYQQAAKTKQQPWHKQVLMAVCILAATAFVFSLGRYSASRNTNTQQQFASTNADEIVAQPSANSERSPADNSVSAELSEPAQSLPAPSASSIPAANQGIEAAAEELAAVTAEAAKQWANPSTHASTSFSEELQPVELAGSQVWIPHEHVLSLDSAAGVVVLLHGCSHTAEVWATGAEERPVVQQLLSARLWPVSITSLSSRGGDSAAPGGCWDSFSPMHENEDIRTVTDTVAAVARRWGVSRAALSGTGPAGQPSYHITRLPLFAIGASSGAAFLSVLATVIQFSAVGLYIMPPSQDAIMLLAKGGRGRLELDGPAAASSVDNSGRTGLPSSLQAKAYPACMFLHMPRDTQTAKYTREAMSWMRKEAGMPPSSVVEFELLPRRLHKRTFSDAMPSLLTDRASMKLFFLMEEAAVFTGDTEQGRGGLAGPPSARRLQGDGASLASASSRDDSDSRHISQASLGKLAANAAGESRNWSKLEHDPTDGQWLAVDPRRSEAIAGILSRFVDHIAGPTDFTEGEGSHAHTHDIFDIPLGIADGAATQGLSPEEVLERAVRSSTGFEDSSAAGHGGAGQGSHPLAATDAHAAARAILRRNLAEVLNERFAVHEMSAQGRKELVQFFAQHAESRASVT